MFARIFALSVLKTTLLGLIMSRIYRSRLRNTSSGWEFKVFLLLLLIIHDITSNTFSIYLGLFSVSILYNLYLDRSFAICGDGGEFQHNNTLSTKITRDRWQHNLPTRMQTSEYRGLCACLGYRSWQCS